MTDDAIRQAGEILLAEIDRLDRDAPGLYLNTVRMCAQTLRDALETSPAIRAPLEAEIASLVSRLNDSQNRHTYDVDRLTGLLAKAEAEIATGAPPATYGCECSTCKKARAIIGLSRDTTTVYHARVRQAAQKEEQTACLGIAREEITDRDTKRAVTQRILDRDKER